MGKNIFVFNFYIMAQWIGEIFGSGRATLYKNPSDWTVAGGLKLKKRAAWENTYWINLIFIQFVPTNQ